MAATTIDNLFIPDIWETATREAATERHAVINSPAVVRSPLLDALITPSGNGGEVITLPHFKPAASTSRVQTNASGVPVDNVTAALQKAVIRNREFALGAESLSDALSGTDPVGFITSSLGEIEVTNKQADLISTLRGVFGTALAALSKNIHEEAAADVDADTKIDADVMLDAAQLMGDHKSSLAVILMHSQVETNLKKQDLIDYERSSDGSMVLATYMGKPVFVDDSLTRAGTGVGTPAVYETYLASVGSIAHGVAAPDSDNPIGVNRISINTDVSKNVMAVIRRYRYTLHVRGTKWVGDAAAAGGPTDAELATADNWAKVYETKNIGLVRILSNG